jgi:hypothetical protein
MSAPSVTTSPAVFAGPAATGSSSHSLTAEENERIRKKAERVEQKRQRKQVRDETKTDIKSKVHEATGKKAKLQLYATLLKLRLHL